MVEGIRLKAVERFIYLDFETDKELPEIVELAAAVCNTPYAFISLIKEDTQYLKIKKGITETEIQRQLSFCNDALEQSGTILIADLQTNMRFANNPLVINTPFASFYAGTPLITSDGQQIGSLGVLHSTDHDLNEHQQLMLKILASQAMKIMELKLGAVLLEKHREEAEEQKKWIDDANIRLRSFFESSSNFQVLLDKNGQVIDFNKTAFNFIKTVHKADLKRGDMFIPYLAPAFVSIFIDRYKQALEGKKLAEEGSTDYGELGVIWWEANFEPARDQHEEIIGISYLIRNVTERKVREQKILDQNQSLLKIAHIQTHDFRAPLTTIMGLMNLIKEEDYNAPLEYFQYLEHAVSNLDDKIKQIVTNIEGNIGMFNILGK